MLTTPYELSSLYRADLDPLFRLAALAFEGGEKLMRLNFEASRGLLAQAQRVSTAVLSVRSAEELIGLQAGWLAPASEEATAWGRAVNDIVQASGAQWREIVEEGNTAVLQGGFASLFDAGLRALANAPEPV